MKTALFLIMIMLSGMSLAESFQQKATDACNEKPESTSCLAASANEDAAEAQAKIEERYKALLSKESSLSKEQKAALGKAKRSWSEFSSSICQLKQNMSGSAYSVVLANCKNELARQHLDIINGL